MVNVSTDCIKLIYEDNDRVLIRFIESWTDEKGKKQSKVAYKLTRHILASELDDFLKQYNSVCADQNLNMHMGVNPREGDKHDFSWQIRTVRNVWADLDDCSPAEALERCEQTGLPVPTTVLDSGNGAHLYWRLTEPYLITDAGESPAVESEWVKIKGKNILIRHYVQDGEKVYLNDPETGRALRHNVPALSEQAQHLEHIVSGVSKEIGGDHTTDLARMLRMPGTLNRKNARNGAEPKPCEAVGGSGESYDLALFEPFAAKSEQKQQRERIASIPLPQVKHLTPHKQDKLNDFILACRLTPPGTRSERDFALCAYAIDKGISRDEVQSRVSDVGKFAEGGEPYFDRTWQKAEAAYRERKVIKAQGDGAEIEGSTCLFDEPENCTQIAMSNMFLEMHGKDIRFEHSWGKWIIWDGTRWKIDTTGQIMKRAKQVAESVWNIISEDTSLLERHYEFATSVSTKGYLKSMVDLAASDCAVSHTELNRDIWLLNCPNGTVDLRTGELREHRRADLLTYIAPTNFNPDAESYHFDRFLEDIFELQDLIDFNRRLFGMFLTGSVKEQKLLIFHGVGANGKTTLLNAFLQALGDDYTLQAPAGLLMATQSDKHPTELASLYGKRLAVCTETEQGRKMAKALMKSLTGGDKISARRMREDFWEFEPTHKLVICTNHKPQIADTDQAIWRRILLNPFEVVFSEDRQNKNLPDKLRAEAEGILAWAVRGCLEWQRDGLNPPDCIKAATKEYQSEEDIIGQFISDVCLTGPTYTIKAADFCETLNKWCENEGYRKITQTKVGADLKTRGIDKHKSNGTWYLGIGIRANLTEWSTQNGQGF